MGLSYSGGLMMAVRQKDPQLHGPLLNSFEGDVYIGSFLDKPFERLNGQKDIEAY